MNINDFGFEAIEEIPVDENDHKAMLRAFTADDSVKIIKKEIGSKKASNIAASIRKAAEAMPVSVDVIVKDGVIYISK